MEEQKKVERTLMSQEEFEKYIDSNRGLRSFVAVGKFKSVNRAIKRGLVTDSGTLIPRRPFNNRANTSRRDTHSRVFNEVRRSIYGQLKQYR